MTRRGNVVISSVFSSMVAIKWHLFLSIKLNPKCQGIFSFFRLKLKKERFFLVFLPSKSVAEAKDPESDCDSSSTVGGRSECCETFKASAALTEAMDDTLELPLLGRGGFAANTGFESSLP